MQVLKTIQTVEGEKLIVELTPNEAILIQRSMTRIVRRKVHSMSIELGKLCEELQTVKKHNDDFIATFYHGKSKMNPKGHPRKRGAK